LTEPLQRRAAGVLMHVSSLPGPYFLGDLGPAAHQFIDFLASAGQSYWQMLPVVPIGDGNSPYSTISSFAGEALFISPELLVRDGLLKKDEIKPPAGGAARKASYAKARKVRGALLKTAFERALLAPGWRLREDFEEFCEAEQAWLVDFALFAALSGKRGTADFSTWPEELRERKQGALSRVVDELKQDIVYISFLQFQFRRQWTMLRQHAAANGIQLIGDLPIFVSARSADVWAARQNFYLDDKGKPTVVAGCPPDQFNADGQLWGNALYDWAALKKDGYDFWVRRIQQILGQFDAVRLDHFIGFYRYWEIQAKAKNARGGVWKLAQGDDFFTKLKARLGGKLPFIAEDLGAVVPEVRALRDKFGLPGMKLVEFAFDGSDEAATHLPYALPQRSAVYTGTHDNQTAKGWYADLSKRAAAGGKAGKAAKTELDTATAYLGATPAKVHMDMIRAAFGAKADTAIIPLQDWLGLGAGARMNVPGVPDGNWEYRADAKDLTKDLAAEMRAVTKAFRR
jgi:4-alpha-glucanotransferase